MIPAQMKIEARSPSSCNSEYSYLSASPPHSPSISEAGSNAYSTDEGIVEDMSDLEGESRKLQGTEFWCDSLLMWLSDFFQLVSHLLNVYFPFSWQKSWAIWAPHIQFMKMRRNNPKLMLRKVRTILLHESSLAVWQICGRSCCLISGY